MTTFDVIVVGAGPAGSTCADRLNRSGLRVRLFDKKVFPRVKPCAGWVTPQVIEALQIDIAEYRRDHVFQPITGFRTGIIGGRVIETSYHHPVSYGILRPEFDNWLLQRSGVPCDFRAVRQIGRDGNVWSVDGAAAPLIVGAGGHFCPVARRLEARSGSQGRDESVSRSRPGTWTVVYAQEVEFPMSSPQRQSNGVRAEVPELYFCNDMRGYGWCFRKGDYLNVGLGRADRTDLSAHVQDFCQFLRDQGRLLDDPPAHFLGHAYQLYSGPPPRLYDDGVLLIGDAAGLAYPQSGEGIRPAIESAIIAADVIANAGGDYSSPSLARYGSRLMERLGRPGTGKAPGWIPPSWLPTIAARLLATRWFTRNVVIENWFLHRHQDTLAIPPAPSPADNQKLAGVT